MRLNERRKFKSNDDWSDRLAMIQSPWQVLMQQWKLLEHIPPIQERVVYYYTFIIELQLRCLSRHPVPIGSIVRTAPDFKQYALSIRMY